MEIELGVSEAYRHVFPLVLDNLMEREGDGVDDLAYLLGVTGQTVRYWQAGTRRSDTGSMYALTRYAIERDLLDVLFPDPAELSTLVEKQIVSPRYKKRDRRRVPVAPVAPPPPGGFGVSWRNEAPAPERETITASAPSRDAETVAETPPRPDRVPEALPHITDWYMRFPARGAFDGGDTFQCRCGRVVKGRSAGRILRHIRDAHTDEFREGDDNGEG